MPGNTPAPTIYVDLDDVLCDTAGRYLEIVKEDFNKSFTFDEIFSFNLQESFSLNDEQNSRMFERAHRPEFTLSLLPFPGITTTFTAWLEQGFEIAIVTGRHTKTYRSTLQWLEIHSIPYNSFIMVDKYGWPDTDRDIAISLDHLSQMRFSFAIEDNITMAGHLCHAMGIPVILFDRPWNRLLADSRSILRCRSWEDIARATSRRKHAANYRHILD